LKIKREDALLTASVTPATLKRCHDSAADFLKWSRQRGWLLMTPEKQDRALKAYFVDMFEDGFGVWEGRNTFYGSKMLHLKTASRSVLSTAHASLRGWAKKSPGKMRLPAPEIMVDNIALSMLEAGQVDSAAAAVLQQDTYFRPSEVIGLRMGQVLPPANLKGRAKSWGLVVGMSEWGEKTKTGQQDDSVLVADTAHSWLSQVLAELYDKQGDDHKQVFPNLTLAKYESHVRAAVKKLRYDHLAICPHVFRHSGASNDMAQGRRTLESIRKRGRWASPKSVVRYERGALILQQLKKLTEQQKKRAEENSEALPSRLLAALRATRATTGMGRKRRTV